MIIFVGDKPSKRMKRGAPAFQGARCEKRLQFWIKTILGSTDLEVVLGLKNIRIFNSTDTHLDAWIEVKRIIFGSDVHFIALGNNASDHLAFKHVPHFKLPHPSGRNRQINDETLIRNKLQECREWLNLK